MQIDALTLHPDRPKALGWTGVGAIATAMGVWLIADLDPSAERLALVLWGIVLGLSVAVTAWFAVQAVAPNLVEVRLGPEGVRARTGWVRREVPWDLVESASIREAFGEPYLRLRVIDEVEGGWLVTPRIVVLPVGVDTAALRMGLARARAAGRVGSPDAGLT